MKNTQHFFVSLIVVALLSSCGANYHLRQGNRLFNQMAYNSAITEYEKSLASKQLADAKTGLAESYRLVNNPVKAEEAYARVMEVNGVKPIYKLRYAQLLMRNAKYSQAKIWLDNYLKEVPADKCAMDLRESCDKIDELKKDSAAYSVTSIKINTGQNNFSPVYYKDGIVFATDRSTITAKSKMYAWTGLPFLDLYFSKKEKTGDWGMPMALSGDVNGKYHEGSATFASDSIMYFTRNNYVGKKLGMDGNEVTNLKIYMATKRDTSWRNVTEFPFNSDNYSCGHPTVSKDGNTMYFVSDMPGSMDNSTDIWMCRKENGVWNKPVNMGTKVNTPLKEMFPTIYHDSILYFSSEGHTNLGGLDIFSATKNGNDWGDAVNMKYPVNSNHDDFGIIVNDTGTAGLFSSNRATGLQDNIYSFEKIDLRFTLEGIAVEKATQLPLAGVEVVLTNKTTGTKETVITGPDGKFFFKLEPESEFTVVGSKDNFFTNTEAVSTVGKKKSENMYVELKLEMEKIIINKPIALENIYYDLDKSDIRPDAAAGCDKLVSIMKDNPDISIELGSHTDSRADDKYNMALSQRRAESAVNYLISHGIAKERVIARGYGESRLYNGCKNDVKCSEAEHQQNRRTEFKVIGIGAKKVS